jgi:AAA family ATPase
VEKIEPQAPENGIMVPHEFDRTSKIVFRDINSIVDGHGNGSPSVVECDFGDLKGMKSQLDSLSRMLNKGLSLKRSVENSSSLAGLARPILIQGIQGTGKTALLVSLASAKGCKVMRMRRTIVSSLPTKTESNLDKFFDEAIARQPTLILIDDIHSYAGGKSDAIDFAVLFNEQLIRVANHRVQVVATARSQSDIHEQIAPHFIRIIDLPIPDRQARLEILQLYAGEQCTEEVLSRVADRTNAFVARNLDVLVDKAIAAAESKAVNRTSAYSARSDDTHVSHETAALLQSMDGQVQLSAENFEVALLTVHASAMNEVYVEVPKVRWTDIGGSEEIKAHLQKVINPRVSEFSLFRNRFLIVY